MPWEVEGIKAFLPENNPWCIQSCCPGQTHTVPLHDQLEPAGPGSSFSESVPHVVTFVPSPLLSNNRTNAGSGSAPGILSRGAEVKARNQAGEKSRSPIGPEPVPASSTVATHISTHSGQAVALRAGPHSASPAAPHLLLTLALPLSE